MNDVIILAFVVEIDLIDAFIIYVLVKIHFESMQYHMTDWCGCCDNTDIGRRNGINRCICYTCVWLKVHFESMW